MNEFVKSVNSGSLNLDDFCRALVLCHGTRTKMKNQKLNFDHILHEDDCIQSFAKKCGYSFDAHLLISKRICYKINIHGFIEYYPILSIHHSTINRQRFSILFETNEKFNFRPEGGILYIRGSFKQMQNCLRLKTVEKEHLRNICFNLENMGYRVIIYGKKEFKPDEIEESLRKFDMAKTNLTIDDEELENLYSALEQNASFLSLICVEETLKEGVKRIIQKFRQSSLKIGVFSGDSLTRTLSVIYKAKIINYSKEIMVLEGDCPEKILAGVQALLDHMNKVIRKTMDSKEEEKTPISPNKFKELCYAKNYTFDYFLMLHSSALDTIYDNPYLMRHIWFLAYFSDGLLGYELSPKHKSRLLKILKMLPKKINVLGVGNSLFDDKLMDLCECSIEENLQGQINTNNHGDLLVSDLTEIETLIFHKTQEYIDIIGFLVANLVYMNFLLAWPYVFFIIYCGLNPDSLYKVCTYENFCMSMTGVVFMFEKRFAEKKENFFVEIKNRKMFKNLIFNNVFMAFVDGGLLFMFSLMNQCKNYEIIFMVFCIMSLKLYLNQNIPIKFFILMTFCNFLLLILFIIMGTCFGNNLFQPPQEIFFFFEAFVYFLKDQWLSVILIGNLIVFNHYTFGILLIKVQERETGNGDFVKGSEILKILRELFQHKESELLIKEIEESC